MKPRTPIPPDWVMKRIATLRHPFLNKAAVNRYAGLSRGRVALFANAPYITTRREYNKIAAVMQWPEWTDEEQCE